MRRRLTILAAMLVLALGAFSLTSEAPAAPKCPRPGCPLPVCPPCTTLVCDAGHCAFHCELIPGCNP